MLLLAWSAAHSRADGQDTDLHIIPDAHIDRPTYLSQQKHLRATHPTKRFLTSYHSFETLNRTDAALTLKQQWAAMIQRVQGVSAEKAVQFVERWGTPGEFVEDLARYEMEVRDEIVARAEVGGGGGGGGGGGKKAKVRKVEDFVVERLGEGGPRGIKGALGGKIHRLFTQGNNYAD